MLDFILCLNSRMATEFITACVENHDGEQSRQKDAVKIVGEGGGGLSLGYRFSALPVK